MDDTVCPGGPVAAPFLCTRQTTLGTAQSGLRAAQGTGIRHGLPGVGHQLRQQAQVNPHHLACGRQRDHGHGAGDHHVSALAHALEGHRRDGAPHRPVQLDLERAHALHVEPVALILTYAPASSADAPFPTALQGGVPWRPSLWPSYGPVLHWKE
jgi:hypothetical protein